jgi:hypothetical protein
VDRRTKSPSPRPPEIGRLFLAYLIRADHGNKKRKESIDHFHVAHPRLHAGQHLVGKLVRVAYFPDLAPHSYGEGIHPDVVHVGWLDGVHPFPKGPIDRRLVEKLKVLAAKPVELYRGSHICELCPEPADVVKTFIPDRGKLIDPSCSRMQWAEQRCSNGEIRVSSGAVIFAAPALDVHYIEEHGYLPPAEFLEAVEEAR